MPRDAYRIGDSRNYKEEKETGLISEFSSGFSAGIDTTMGTLGGVRALFNTVTGDEEEAMEYLNYARQKFEDASESTGSVQTVEEIEGAGDFVRWALYSAGTVVPSIATSVLGGGVGGYLGKKAAETAVKNKIKKEVYDKVQDDISEAAKRRLYRETLAGATQPYRTVGQAAGAFTSSAAQNTGATYLDVYEETGVEAPDVALAAGVASGALDAITPMVILRRIMPPTVFTKFKDKMSDSIVQNGGVVRRSMLEATKQAGFEGFTEASQELIQATAVGMMQNDPTGGFAEYFEEFNRNIENIGVDEQLTSRLLNAAAVGAIGGSFTGGVSGIFKGEKRSVDDARKDKPTETDTETETEQASKEQQSLASEEEQIQAIIAEFGDIDRKEARRILVQRQTNQETASLELGEEQQALEQQAPFSPLDQAPEEESLELEATRQRQKIAREQAQGLGGEPRRRGVTVDEQRARVYEEELNESMGRVLRGRRVLNEIIPVSLYEGTTTPEENAQAAQEAERITVLPSGPTIELGPNRTMDELSGVARVDSQGNTSISGQTVDYQGIQGTLKKRDDGVFVVVTPEGDEVVVESGESQAGSTAAALLGVRPVDINVDTPASDIQFNPEDQTFISRGKKYRYIETRYDDDGQPVAIDAETMDGQPRVFRSQRTLRAMEAEQAKIQQSEMTQNLATGPAQFDDLSETFQMAVFDQRETQGVDTATDSVTREELEAAVESAPASIQASLRRETEALFARDTETEFDIRQTFRDEDQWLSFEGDVVNANQETLEARQERLDLLSGQPNKPANSDDLITIKGVEGVAEKVGNAMRRKAFFKVEADGQETNLEVTPAENISEIDSSVDSASATNEIQQAIFDLIEAGLPTEFVDDIQAIAVHLAKDMDALGATANDRMSLDSAMVSKSLVDPDSDRELRYVVAHEAWHVIDNKVNVSGTLPSFNVEITFGAEGAKIVLGDALADLYDNYLQGTELGRRFTYPFNEIEQRLSTEADPAKLKSIVESVKNFIKKESFAQLGAVYVSNPRLLKQQAPEAYNVIRTIRDNPTLATGENDARVQDTNVGVQPEGTGVQGEVRPSTVSGSPQVEEDGGLGEAGIDGPEAGQADQGVGGEAQPEAGDSDGSSVQQGLADDAPEQGTLFVRRLERGPTGRPYQGLPANETLGGEDRVQTSLPNGKRQGEKFYETGAPEDYSIGIDRILSDTAKTPVKEKLKNTIEGYNFFTPSRPDLTAEETIEEFKAHMVDNLVWLHDQMDTEIRAEAKQWYDGARKQVDLWVGRYGLEPRQVAAVVANLSPQKDWFMNMSLAERMMDIYNYRQDFKSDKSMDEAFVRIVLSDEKGKRRLKLNPQQQAQKQIWSQIKDKSLSEVATTLPAEQVDLGQAIWVRMYDEAKHSRKFRVMRPSGEIMGLSMGKDGPKNVAWGSFTEIAKGISVLRDGSLENVSLSLGDAHKVRNFYNNIVAPNSVLGEVTIDTHAVAAALFKPLSAKSYEVAHAFGGTPSAQATPQQLGIPDGVVRSGAGSSRVIGVGGTYGIVADAYREAADRLGILPRQLQSITWEEVRVIYPASFKDEKGVNLGKINDLWTRYGNGELSIGKVRDQAYEVTGTKGSKPVWADRSNAESDGESRTSTYNRELYPDGVSGSGFTGSDVGSGGDVDVTAGATSGGVADTVKVGKPNTKVRPSVKRAYAALQSGQITRQEYDETVLETIRPYEAVPTPATAEEMSSALRGTQVSKVNQPVDDGASVGLRLDINAYEKNDTWVPTIHDAKGRPISHMATAAVTGADFTDFKQGKAQKVMEGGTKTPFAQIKGAYVGRSDEENVRLAQQYLNDPEWRQVGFDPRRHATFYDRVTGESIATADEVIQVGPLVLAKNAVIQPAEQTLFVKRLSGQNKTHQDASDDGTLMDGKPSTSEFNLDDETRTEVVIRKLQDKYLPLKKFEEKATEFLGLKELPEKFRTYIGETLHSGKVKDDNDRLEQNYIRPIGTILRENSIDVDDFGIYLIAKHAPERNRYIASINPQIQEAGSGMSDADAERVIASFEADGTAKAMSEAADLTYKMLAENRKRLTESGLVDDDTVDGWNQQYKFYVPLKGFAASLDEDNNLVAPKGLPRGFSISGKEVLAALGRTTQSDNPLLYAMNDVENKIVRARRNEVAQRFLALARELSGRGSKQLTVYEDPASFPMDRERSGSQVREKRMDAFDMREALRKEDNKPRFLSVKEDGKEIFVEIKDQALNNAMHNVSAENFDSLVTFLGQNMNFLQKFQIWRRNTLINYNPSWFVINPLRDIQTGIIYAMSESSKSGGMIEGEAITGDILAGYFPAAHAYFKNLRGGRVDSELDEYFDEYQASGAPTGLTLTREIDEQKKRLENIITEGNLVSNIRKVGDLVQDLNTASENTVRFAAYVASRRNGVEVENAANLAKNMTVNFNRKGEMSAGLNAFYLFFNAAVQGTANIAQAMTGKTASGGLNKAQMAAVGIGLTAYMITEHNILGADEDDDGESLYKDLTGYDKLMSWNIVRPDGKSFFQIPMPYGYGMFHTMGRLSAELAHGLIDENDFAAEITAASVHHFLPPPLGFLGAVGTEDDLMDFTSRAVIDLVPDIIEPFASLSANMNHFGSPIYLEQNSLMDSAPDSSKSKRSTEQVYKDTAQFINEFFGGSEFRKGGVDLSPDAIKYATEFATGGLGRFISRSSDVGILMANEIQKDDPSLGDFPILRYFVGEPSEFSDKVEYYEGIRDLQEVFNEAEALTGNDRKEFLAEFGDKVRLEPLYKQTQKQLRALRQKKKSIEKMQSDPARAYDQIQRIEAQMDLLFDKFNKRYREATR